VLRKDQRDDVSSSLIRQREDRSYPADPGNTRQHALVRSAPITGCLAEKEVNLVIIRDVGVCDGMGGNKLALFGDKREKSGSALIYFCDANPPIILLYSEESEEAYQQS